MGTGRRLRIVTAVTAEVVSRAWRQAEPTRPVAPVRIRCIVGEGRLDGDHDGDITGSNVGFVL
jgi:hypothetical protein